MTEKEIDITNYIKKHIENEGEIIYDSQKEESQ